MANENGRRRDPFLKIAAEFLVLVIGLGVCAIFLQHKISNLLNTTMEQIVARQTSDMANLAEEQFRRELTVLHHAANYIKANPDRSEAILREIYDQSEEGDNAGIVTVNGDFVLGAKLPANDFLRLPWAVRGYDVVDFSYGKGLLLAVPIISGDNVRGILWRLYDDKLVRENFGLSKYNSDRHFIITAHDGAGKLEKRLEVRPHHLNNLQNIKGKIICAGGLLDSKGKMKGSVMVMEFESRALFDEYLASEPYILEGVWETVDVENMNVVIVNGEKVGK